MPGAYNDEVVNPHNIRISGLLRSARNDGDLYRHCEVVTELVEVHEAIQIEQYSSGLLRSARNDGIRKYIYIKHNNSLLANPEKLKDFR